MDKARAGGGHSMHDQLVFALSLILRDRREALEVSQSDLARRSGLHRSYIGDLERGSRNISVKNLSRLAFALEVTASKLLTLAEKRCASAGGLRPKLAAAKTAVKAKTTKVKAKTASKAKATKASAKKVGGKRPVGRPAGSTKKVAATKAAAKKTTGKKRGRPPAAKSKRG